MLSVSASWLIPVIQTKNEQETAEVIGKLFQFQVLSRKRPAPQFRNRLLKKDDLVSFVSGIPGLGTSKAKAMLAHFKSIKNLINAPRTDWLKVPGIGQGIALPSKSLSTGLLIAIAEKIINQAIISYKHSISKRGWRAVRSFKKYRWFSNLPYWQIREPPGNKSGPKGPLFPLSS